MDKNIPINEEITTASIDQEGKIYLGTVAGNLHRFSPDGEESEFFSAIANFPITSLTTWNRLKFFIFFRDPQTFYYLDRFNTLSNTYNLSQYESSLAWLCTPGVDNSIWTLNIGYNELRKYNEQTRQLQLSTPLSIDLNTATQMRAYQNLLIISDSKQGLYFFDQYANLLQQVSITGINCFQVQDKQLIFFADGFIYSVDAFEPQKIEKIKAPNGAFIAGFRSGGHYIFIGEKVIQVYRRAL